MKRIRALSVRQPQAEMIVAGSRRFNDRRVRTHIRGRVYIYASKGSRRPTDRAGKRGPRLIGLPTGVLIGSVEIQSCESRSDGLYRYRLRNPIRFKKPIFPDARPQRVFWWPFGRAR